MLVVSRKVKQAVVMDWPELNGEPSLVVKVTVLKVSGDKVRLGIDAPSWVKVLRCEIAGLDAETIEVSELELLKEIAALDAEL
jgi:carbon storage regulator CsrA